MSINLRNIIIFCLLLTAAVITWVLRKPTSNESVVANTKSGTIGYYLNDTTISRFDDTGQIDYRISAGRIEEIPDSNQLAFENIEITYLDDSDTPWQISAQRGQSGQDQEKISLEQVEIRNTSPRPDQSMAIRAATLQLDQNTRFASSSDEIELEVDGNRLRAMGMTADLRNERIDLESEVRGSLLE